MYIASLEGLSNLSYVGIYFCSANLGLGLAQIPAQADRCDCSCRSQTHFQFLVKIAIAPVKLRSKSGTFCIARHDKHWGEISKQSHLYDLLQKLIMWSTNDLLACKNKCVKLVLLKAQNSLHLGLEEFDPSNCTCI